MRSPEVLSLPISNTSFDMNNEQTMRRTIEQYFAVLRNDVVEVRDKTDSESSLAMRRHQFLLMGASNG